MASTVLSHHFDVCIPVPERFLGSKYLSIKQLQLPRGPSLSYSRRLGKHSVKASSSTEPQGSPLSQPQTGRSPLIRSLLLAGGSAALTAPFFSFIGPAKSEEASLFTDSKDKFSLLVPQGWESGEGKAGTRKVIAFYPTEEGTDRRNTNVNVVITMLGADYTSLGSFGTVENFGETLVNGLDRSWKRPPGQVAKLITAKQIGDLYFVEYTIHQVNMPKQHFVSVVGIRDNGIYNRLFTVTGQYLDEETNLYRKAIEQTVSSFQILS